MGLELWTELKSHMLHGLHRPRDTGAPHLTRNPETFPHEGSGVSLLALASTGRRGWLQAPLIDGRGGLRGGALLAGLCILGLKITHKQGVVG